LKETLALKALSSHTPELADSAYLLTCFTDREYRNLGLARNLVLQALESVPNETKRLIVDVDVEANDALSFYNRLGFRLWSGGIESSSILVWELER
jgi:ribosomal protein S18 acetylase RimI-like enzyme